MVAKSLKHKFTNPKADGADATIARPSDWNADHDLWMGGRTVTGTTDALADSDHLSLMQYNSASAVAVSLAQAGAGGQFLSGWVTWIRARGAGAVTITPTTSTINEAANLVLNQGDFARLQSDGTNYAAVIVRNALPITGGTLTGNLTISLAAPQIILRKTAGNGAVIWGYMGATARWHIMPGDGAAESGSNAGSDFYIGRYGDAGAFIENPLSINRANGQMTLTQPLNIPVSPTASTHATSKGYVDTKINTPIQVTVLASGSGTYPTPAGATYLEVEMIGAGGGGASFANGAGGGNTTFGSYTAGGGSAGGGAGGAVSGGHVNIPGAIGASGTVAISGQFNGNGGPGAASYFGGGGTSGYGAAGGNAVAPGAGGGGAGCDATATRIGGYGGSAGGYLYVMLVNPSASYAYSVGVGGAGQAAGSGYQAAGNGAPGIIIIKAHFGT